MSFANENQHITFVTGKGGVGKSAVAAAIAQKHAQNGRNTLLIELGEQSYFQYLFKRPIGYEPTLISPKFSVALWGGEACLKEYVFYLIRVKKIVDLFFENKIMRTFIRAAPALKELAMLGKITSGIRDWGPPLKFDQIVVDCFSSGHFMALLKAPRGMADLISAGPMGEQSRRIDEVLRRRDLCEYQIVALPEDLPVTETVELFADLKKELNVEPLVICNRIYQPQISKDELEKIVVGSEAIDAKKFAQFVIETKSHQGQQLKILKESFSMISELPFIFKANGTDVISDLSANLKFGAANA